ncbi:MAG: hypothetical protein IKA32_04600, partial [Lentisphaeria bacterium]|nr:hypothetical protein [Lentisphaeria bacterium]
FITFSIMIAVQLCAAFPSVINLEKTAKAEVRNERKEKIIFEKNFGPQYKWNHHNYIHGGAPARDRAAIMALGRAEFTSHGAILTTNAKLRNFRNKSGKPVFFSNNLTFSYPIKKELWGKNLKFTFPVTGSGELELYLVFQGPHGDKNFKSGESLSEAMPEKENTPSAAKFLKMRSKLFYSAGFSVWEKSRSRV